ncbi:hypothetical protein GCM10011581_31410 [Saccharopolyspora subtropica]|uniref:Uncharacterized protein n=1 Tax=Saccharopolyspora thermophila TaxID=89367 RepID=A0A917JYU9_9PSEU|nr:hypothetical protein GCM10011581_31410 [Saccharopolyspora subtropica]
MLITSENEAELDHHQARSWRAWYAHITLSMLAPAWLASNQSSCDRRGISVGDDDMIAGTLPEIRRLVDSSIVGHISTKVHRAGEAPVGCCRSCAPRATCARGRWARERR